jgi:hypothetical protein
MLSNIVLLISAVSAIVSLYYVMRLQNAIKEIHETLKSFNVNMMSNMPGPALLPPTKLMTNAEIQEAKALTRHVDEVCNLSLRKSKQQDEQEVVDAKQNTDEVKEELTVNSTSIKN